MIPYDSHITIFCWTQFFHYVSAFLNIFIISKIYINVNTDFIKRIRKSSQRLNPVFLKTQRTSLKWLIRSIIYPLNLTDTTVRTTVEIYRCIFGCIDARYRKFTTYNYVTCSGGIDKIRIIQNLLPITRTRRF